MEIPIPSDVNDIKDLWDAWDIRVCILTSLFLQGLLVSTASYKKRTSNSSLERLISSSYSLVEWVCPYALGLIPDKLDSSTVQCLSKLSQVNNHDHQPSNRPVSRHLLTFWAPFLLLHLGGPNNITYLSLDDNEMWLKHLVGLVSNVLAVAIVFRRSLPHVGHQNTFFLPAILVFIGGFIKYVERTRALYLASSNSWEKSTLTQTKPNPGSDFEKLRGTHLAMREGNLPTEIQSVKLPPKMFKVVDSSFEKEGPLDDQSLLKFAHCFYINFKGFVGCLSFSLNQRQFMRRFFLKRTGRDAFKLLEMELSFLHDAPHVQSKNVFFTRVVISTSSIVAAALLFLVYDKSWLSKTDIFITYVLLLGAIVLEIISVFMIVMSDRFVIAYDCNWTKTIAAAIINKRRWSESISMRNLISHCIHGKPNKLPDHSLTRNLLERFKIIRTPTLDFTLGSVKDMIFNELKIKSAIAENIETATKICSQRGDWVLMRNSCYSQLKWSLGEVEYGKSLLLWHIATDLCYCACVDNPDNERRFCKTISDYMLYLLVMKPTMMDLVADNWPQIFRDTSAEAKRLFHKRSLTVHRKACEAILSVDTEFEPVVLKGDQSESVLFDACRLAKQLMDREEPWKLMSGVWVELLGYAAVNCKATVHAQQPSQGGELLTFVWLLMNRLGLGMQFKEEPARTRSKLVVKK